MKTRSRTEGRAAATSSKVNRFAALEEEEEEEGGRVQDVDDEATTRSPRPRRRGRRGRGHRGRGEDEDEEAEAEDVEDEATDQVPAEATEAAASRLPPERAGVPYDYYAVLDFECTCDRQGWHAHEIIEFPVVFLNALTLQVDMIFRRFVRPTEKPRLTDFCRELTGITQADVEAAEPLDRVMLEFHAFLRAHALVSRRGDRSADLRLFCLCTDGPWDLQKFLLPECHRKRIRLEDYWRSWVDVRAAVASELNCSRTCINAMLYRFGLDFEGRPHSGLDDARNIARLVAELLRRGRRVVPGR